MLLAFAARVLARALVAAALALGTPAAAATAPTGDFCYPPPVAPRCLPYPLPLAPGTLAI